MLGGNGARPTAGPLAGLFSMAFEPNRFHQKLNFRRPENSKYALTSDNGTTPRMIARAGGGAPPTFRIMPLPISTRRSPGTVVIVGGASTTSGWPIFEKRLPRHDYFRRVCRPSTAVSSRTALMDRSARPRGKRGPAPLDPTREATTVTLQAAVKQRAREIAQRDGISMTNVIERELCQAWGLPVPYYCQPKPADQEELPLTKAS